MTAGEGLGGLQNACGPPCAPQGAPSPVGLRQDLPRGFTLVRYRKATGYKKSTTKRFPLLYTYKQVSSEIVKLKGLCCCCLLKPFLPPPSLGSYFRRRGDELLLLTWAGANDLSSALPLCLFTSQLPRPPCLASPALRADKRWLRGLTRRQLPALPRPPSARQSTACMVGAGRDRAAPFPRQGSPQIPPCNATGCWTHAEV